MKIILKNWNLSCRNLKFMLKIAKIILLSLIKTNFLILNGNKPSKLFILREKIYYSQSNPT